MERAVAVPEIANHRADRDPGQQRRDPLPERQHISAWEFDDAELRASGELWFGNRGRLNSLGVSQGFAYARRHMPPDSSEC